jgi:hypothetical protein
MTGEVTTTSIEAGGGVPRDAAPTLLAALGVERSAHSDGEGSPVGEHRPSAYRSLAEGGDDAVARPVTDLDYLR